MNVGASTPSARRWTGTLKPGTVNNVHAASLKFLYDCTLGRPQEVANPIALFADWREALRALTGLNLAICPLCGAQGVQRYPVVKLDTDARAPLLAA